MKRNQGKGKANDISGIPLPGAIPQVEGQSVEPNRDEPEAAFQVNSDSEKAENFAHDYFDDEEERLGNLEAPFVANKDDEEWSDGLADEENENDDMSDDGLLPETQPLHVDPSVNNVGQDDDADVVLRPTQIGDDAA